MLTVKHAANGCEEIISIPEGAAVIYVGVHGEGPKGDYERPAIYIRYPDTAEGTTRIQVRNGGTAYVTNEHGATVGVYRLE